MNNQRDSDKVAVTFYVPKQLKALVKARLDEKGETMTAVLIRALKRYVK